MNDEETAAFDELLRSRNGVDRFGVPNTLMGIHDEDFFSALGRIVPLCALLENHLLTICQGLTGSGQHEHTRRDVSKLIELSEKELAYIADSGDQSLIATFLTEADQLVRRRNDYVHSLWPAQSGRRLFAWRPSRTPGEQAALTLETNLDEMKAYLAQLCDTLYSPRWQRIQQIAINTGIERRRPSPR